MTRLLSTLSRDAEVIRALGRMAVGARERGHYSLDRRDAGWIEAAIDLLCGPAEREHCGARVGTQSCCTRDAGHDGEHRCLAADVDARKAGRPTAP